MESMSTDEERMNFLNTIFNKVDLKSVNALLANTGDRFDELSKYINNAAGAAERMAETQLDNLAGDITLMKSAVEGVQIAISDKLSPSLRKATQFFTGLIGTAQEFIEDGGLDDLVQTFRDLAPVIVSATVAFAAFKAGMAVTGIVKGFQEAQVAISLLTMEIGGANLAQAALNGTLTIGETIVGVKASVFSRFQRAVSVQEIALPFLQRSLRGSVSGRYPIIPLLRISVRENFRSPRCCYLLPGSKPSQSLFAATYRCTLVPVHVGGHQCVHGQALLP